MNIDLYQSALGVNADYKEAAGKLRDAMRLVAETQAAVDDTERQMVLVEADTLVSVTGGNESQRKAAATVALGENDGYRQLATVLRREKLALGVARAEVEYQETECQRLRSFLSLLSNAIVAAGAG